MGDVLHRGLGGGTLAASVALHALLGAALLVGRASEARPADAAVEVEVVHAPVRAVEDQTVPDEPEGGSASASGVAASARTGRGRGRGHRSGDARGVAPPTHAMVTLGDPEVEALELGLPRGEILRTLVARASEVRACASLDGDTFARVVVGFTVAADGRVVDSHVVRSTLGDPAVESCMAAAIRAWSFPAAANGGATSVTYPFVVAREP